MNFQILEEEWNINFKRLWRFFSFWELEFMPFKHLHLSYIALLPAQVPRPPSPALLSPSCPVPSDRWTWHGECRVLEVRSPSCTYHRPSPPAVRTSKYNLIRRLSFCYSWPFIITSENKPQKISTMKKVSPDPSVNHWSCNSVEANRVLALLE